MTQEDSLKPCERFTVLESRRNHEVARCDVCDHLEEAHQEAGRRLLSGGEIEEMRRVRLIATFEKVQDERRRLEPDVPSANGNAPASGEGSGQ